MNYEILNTSYYKQAVNKTEVQIYCKAPYTIITRDIAGNVTDKSNEELVKAVLDTVASEYDPSSKLSQLDALVDKLENKLKEADEAIAEIKKEAAVTQGAVIEAIENFSAQIEEIKDVNHKEADEPKTTVEGGESNDGNVNGN